MGSTAGLFAYVHTTPGRVRVRLARGLSNAHQQARIERALRALPGVRHVAANPLTGSVLILFDPTRLDARDLLARIEPFGRLDAVPLSAPGWRPLPDLAWQIGAVIGKELARAAIARAVGKSPIGLFLNFV